MQEIMEMSVAERILMIERIWDSIDHDNIETPCKPSTGIGQAFSSL
jgi:putative addiction module component (TIGR02574 family)